MKLVKFYLSAAVFATLCFIQVVPSWAGAIPRKSDSSYGANDQQVILTTPTFTPISQNGVNISLDSVFCTNDACNNNFDATGQALSYFFAITMSPNSQLNSLTFGPDFNDFLVTTFDSTFTCADNFSCVPPSSPNLDFTNVGMTLDCSSGDCIATFTNFNTATIGTGTIIFAAGTPDGSILNVDGIPQTPPLLSANTSLLTVSVPEPNSVWFVVIVGLACLLFVSKKRKQLVA